jgi:hypothetical protein
MVSRRSVADDGGLPLPDGGCTIDESKIEPHFGQRAFLPGGNATFSFSSVWQLGQTTTAFAMVARRSASDPAALKESSYFRTPP